jgi:hypothetical protein
MLLNQAKLAKDESSDDSLNRGTPQGTPPNTPEAPREKRAAQGSRIRLRTQGSRAEFRGSAEFGAPPWANVCRPPEADWCVLNESAVFAPKVAALERKASFEYY